MHIDERTFGMQLVGSWLLESGNVEVVGLAVFLGTPPERAIGFFFRNVEISSEL
mgnify:CR=1 FL=1